MVVTRIYALPQLFQTLLHRADGEACASGTMAKEVARFPHKPILLGFQEAIERGRGVAFRMATWRHCHLAADFGRKGHGVACVQAHHGTQLGVMTHPADLLGECQLIQSEAGRGTHSSRAHGPGGAPVRSGDISASGRALVLQTQDRKWWDGLRRAWRDGVGSRSGSRIESRTPLAQRMGWSRVPNRIPNHPDLLTLWV